MLFLKAQINDEIEIKVPLYGDQIFSTCPVCGKETQVDEEMLHSILEDDGDLAATSVYCGSCSEEYQRNIRPEKDPE